MNDKLGTTIINSNVTISQIAKSTGYSESDILLTIEGVKPINEYLAKHLAILLGHDEHYWLEIQRKYDNSRKSSLYRSLLHIVEILIDIGIPSLFVSLSWQYVNIHNKLCVDRAIHIIPAIMILCVVIYIIKQVKYAVK